MAIALRRPMMAPILPPVIMNAAMTSVYMVIAVWMPETVVPTSWATDWMETFMTDASRVMRNWPDDRTKSTRPPPPAAGSADGPGVDEWLPGTA